MQKCDQPQGWPWCDEAWALPLLGCPVQGQVLTQAHVLHPEAERDWTRLGAGVAAVKAPHPQPRHSSLRLPLRASDDREPP